MGVITDSTISYRSRVVYSFLAGCAFDGPRVSVGQRFIAEALGASLGSVNQSMKELARVGHVVAIPSDTGKRNAYELKSPVYSYTRARRYVGKLTLTQRMAQNWALTQDEKPN